MKTHLTQSEYQSLPVNEQCNWKPVMQYSFKELELPIWHDCEIDGYDPIVPTGTITQLIYIPINPESVLNAEMGSITKISDINPVHVEAMLRYPVPFTPERISFIKGAEFGHSQGKKDHNKEVIDTVVAEIDALNSEREFMQIKTLTDLLTKLKEIK